MIQRLPRAAALTAALALAGCATGPTASETPGAPAPPPSQSEALLQERIGRLEQEVAALRGQVEAMRPTHERLASVEGDIRALLVQLSQVPGRPAKPAAAPPAAPASKPAAPASAPPRPADPLDPTSGAAGFGAHLASYRQPVEVAEGWNALQRQLGADIAGLAPRVVGIDFGDGRGTFYRLKVGPLKNREAAEELCRKLRAKAVFCEPGDFAGTPGEDFWRKP
jgi:hypothetical protein